MSFFEKILATLRRAPASALNAIAVLHLEGLEISFHEKHAKVAGRTTRLTATELELLHYFVTHSNVVLPGHRILQAVWGPDYGHEVDYLQVCISQLRKKIEPNPCCPRYLVTEPRIGYRFLMPPDGVQSAKVPA